MAAAAASVPVDHNQQDPCMLTCGTGITLKGVQRVRRELSAPDSSQWLHKDTHCSGLLVAHLCSCNALASAQPQSDLDAQRVWSTPWQC